MFTVILFLALETLQRIVAFDVRLTKHIRHLPNKKRVVFDTADLNEGKGYDTSTGIFTAPAAGVYVFDWTTNAIPGSYARTSLVVNGKIKSWNRCDNKASRDNLSCSKMTVAMLKQGDKVWIGVFSENADMHDFYTSFSGFKL